MARSGAVFVSFGENQAGGGSAFSYHRCSVSRQGRRCWNAEKNIAKAVMKRILRRAETKTIKLRRWQRSLLFEHITHGW